MDASTGRIVYPPLDVPKPFAPGVFLVDSGPHRAFGIPLPVRMTVMRHSDGGLILHSPTRLAAGLADALAAIGEVRHLIAPNAGHYSYIAEWQRAFPQAMTWAAPGMERLLRLRGRRLAIDRTLDDAPPTEWAGEIDQAVVPGAGAFREVVFVHRESRTIVLTDLVASLEPDKLPAWLRAGARAAGATAPRSRAPAYLRAAVSMRRAGARAAMERMLAHHPERAVFAHGTPFEERAEERLRSSLSWLLAG
jgi:hypothetical protein